jgi:hypothetical protein
VYLYEIALSDSIPSTRYKGNDGGGSFPMTRLKMLFACFEATKSCFDVIFGMPDSTWLESPYILWTLIGHASVILSKLCLFNAEGWDAEYVRNTLDFLAVIDRMASKLERAKGTATATAAEPAVSGQDIDTSANNITLPWCTPSIFRAITPKLQLWKDVHETHRAAQMRQMKSQQQQHQEHLQQIRHGHGHGQASSTAPGFSGSTATGTTTADTAIPTASDIDMFPPPGADNDDDYFMPGVNHWFEFLDDSFWTKFT